ncbi:MAG: sensor domain-containing diguanylate cyclase, partial [Nitrospirota bacterium]
LKEMEGISEPFPYNSVLSLPLLWEEKIIGSLAMYNKLVYNSFSCTFFNEDDKEILEKYVQYVARALLNAQQYKDREALVTIDELTGLRNERYLKIRLPEEIRRADRYQRAISLVFMDVDKFRDIVKGMQESARKEVIKKLAGIIRENFRNVDIIVRLEESKFAVLLPDTGERVKEAIQRMSGNLRSVKIKNVSTGNITPLQLMIGYSTYPYDSNDINTLIENASKMVPVG